MSQSSKGHKPPEFLSTHPSDETRIKQIEMWLPEARQYYQPNALPGPTAPGAYWYYCPCLGGVPRRLAIVCGPRRAIPNSATLLIVVA